MQLFAILSQVLVTISVSWGMGKHVNLLSRESVTMSLKYSWVSQVTNYFVTSVGKVAVVAYIASIQGRSNAKPKRILLWTVGSLQMVVCIVTIFFIFAQCTPVAKLWNETLQGSCNRRQLHENFAIFAGSRYGSAAYAKH